MLLQEPPSTPLDLRLRLFGVDVRVSPFFWLISVMLGYNLSQNPVIEGSNGTWELCLWVLASFVSILLHEFGHVWMGQLFGQEGHIVLHGMGGLAIGSSGMPERWKRIFVSAAGPGIQFLLWGVLMGCVTAGLFRGQPSAVRFFLYIMLVVNFVWPILNLLPIWPLDGGQIARDFFGILAPRKGPLAALWLSLVLSVALGLWVLLQYNRPEYGLPGYRVGPFTGFLFALFAVGSWQAIQVEQARSARAYEYQDDRLPWER